MSVISVLEKAELRINLSPILVFHLIPKVIDLT